MKKFIGYYRVSTKVQEHSHLGLDAQRNSVLAYIKNNGNQLIAEYTEIESGRKDKRPELEKAVNLALREKATLVIARLDRLSRSVWLIAELLMKTKCPFVCCDMPMADHTTLFIIAALAQREAELISNNTIAALKAKRLREPDWKAGKNNFTPEGNLKAYKTISETARTDKSVRHAWHFIKPRREQGLSFYAIAKLLNDEGYKTRTGKLFQASSVQNIWERFKR